MIELVRAAADLQAFCEARGWRFRFIGGLVVQMWSELRAVPDAAAFAERSCVLLLKTPDGMGIDVALGALEFEERAVARSRKVEMMPGWQIRVCSPEDLIVFKVFAARVQDRRDVEMTIVRQGDAALNWKYIHEQLVPLLELKEQPDLLDQLEALRARLLRNP